LESVFILTYYSYREESDCLGGVSIFHPGSKTSIEMETVIAVAVVGSDGYHLRHHRGNVMCDHDEKSIHPPDFILVLQIGRPISTLV
jgi:hypothetical protein